jgi:hypothetical protein
MADKHRPTRSFLLCVKNGGGGDEEDFFIRGGSYHILRCSRRFPAPSHFSPSVSAPQDRGRGVGGKSRQAQGKANAATEAIRNEDQRPRRRGKAEEEASLIILLPPPNSGWSTECGQKRRMRGGGKQTVQKFRRKGSNFLLMFFSLDVRFSVRCEVSSGDDVHHILLAWCIV